MVDDLPMVFTGVTCSLTVLIMNRFVSMLMLYSVFNVCLLFLNKAHLFSKRSCSSVLFVAEHLRIPFAAVFIATFEQPTPGACTM